MPVERAPDFSDPNLALPAVMGRNERKVRASFWAKLRGALARVPFAEDLAAAYFCATDSATPLRARAILFAALAYFIAPIDLAPDLLPMIGFTDDATVLATAIAMIRAHMTDAHRGRARETLARLRDDRPA